MPYACPNGDVWVLDPRIAFDVTSSWMRLTGRPPAGVACPRHNLYCLRTT